jgi:hypothetical protein
MEKSVPLRIVASECKVIGVSESPGLASPATLRSVKKIGDATMDVRCGSARRPLSRPVASQNVIGEI